MSKVVATFGLLWLRAGWKCCCDVLSSFVALAGFKLVGRPDSWSWSSSVSSR